MYKEAADNIYLVEIPLPNSPLKVLNSYFIRSDAGGRNLIIDSGFNNEICREAFYTAMDELGFTMENTDFYATHMHGDHIGLIQSIENINIYLGRLDAEYLERREEQNKITGNKGGRDINLATKLFGMPSEYVDVLFKAEFLKNRNYKRNDYIRVDEGDKFIVGKYNFQAVLFKGHSPGQTALYDKDKKILICGDHILGNISPNITFWETGFYSLGSYLNSLEKAKKMDIKQILCGHRSNDFDVYARIDEIIKHHKARLDEVVDILNKEQRNMTAYQIASKMTWSVKADMWSKYTKEQQWFASGEALAHLEHLHKKERIKKYIIDEMLYYSI
ncbi:MAG: MBL fold metallo-hydrolase [Eubacteriaceae bacterium]|nr:MBL fold metallo-hydrolase [Eubacteriaceae bacterium]